MKLELGKRYVRRDGEVTGPLEKNDGNPEYPFWDNEHCYSYTPEGTNDLDYVGCPLDIIRKEGDKASPEMRNADRPASEMTKREAIARDFMVKALEIGRTHSERSVGIARLAIQSADALLAELEKPQPEDQ
jgi:hypothetical protein